MCWVTKGFSLANNSSELITDMNSYLNSVNSTSRKCEHYWYTDAPCMKYPLILWSWGWNLTAVGMAWWNKNCSREKTTLNRKAQCHPDYAARNFCFFFANSAKWCRDSNFNLSISHDFYQGNGISIWVWRHLVRFNSCSWGSGCPFCYTTFFS